MSNAMVFLSCALAAVSGVCFVGGIAVLSGGRGR